jgi:uncharacterized protein YbjT (DUF2867 family)
MSAAETSPSPSAFVAGATGYTGREVVRALRARGIRAIGHVRPDSSRLEEWRSRFGDLGAEVDTTPWDEAAMRATVERLRPSVIFALLGTTRARAREARARRADASRESYEAVDYGLTARLLCAAVQAGYRPRFVYLSSLGVSDDAPGAYVRARARLERELKASGLPYTIARPSFITGVDRDEPRPMERIAAGVGDAILGAAALLGGKRIRDRYASIDAATLAEGLVAWGLDPAGENRVLDADALRRSEHRPG